MKFLKSLSAQKSLLQGRFVYIKINENIEDVLRKDSENKEKSAKQRLNDGKHVAMNTLPSWANDMTDEILKGESRLSSKWHDKESRTGKFWEALKGNESVKSVENFVKSKVFKVIEGGVSNGELSPRLVELMEDIDKNQSRAENTIGDIDQALGTVGKLSDALKNQLDKIQKYQKADNARKHFWQRLRRKQSDLEIFTQRRSVIENALTKLNTNLAERKSETEKDIKDTAQTAREEFDDLSPTEQMQFRTQMAAEITQNKNYHREDVRNNVLDSKFILGVMSNQPLHRRLEIYKLAQLDETTQNRDLLLATTRFQGESEKFKRADETFEIDRGKIKNLQDLKENFSKGIEPSEIKPHNDLKGLVSELETEFRGIFSDLKGEVWTDYPPNYELTDLQKITAFWVKLGDGNTNSAKKIKKSLRIKLLGYLEHINTEENGEELGAYSVEFIDAEKDAKNELETTKNYFATLNSYKDLSDIYENGAIKETVLKNLNNKSFAVSEKVNELKDIAKNLAGEEKTLLEKYIKSLSDAAAAMTEIRGIWLKEVEEFEKRRKEHVKKQNKLSSKQSEFRKNVKDMQKDGSNFIKNTKSKGSINYGNKSYSIKKRVNPKFQEYRENLNKFTSKLSLLKKESPVPDSAKFTKFNTKFSDNFKALRRDFKSIEKAVRTSKNIDINDNIVQFLERQSKNDIHEKSKAEFQKLQEDMLTSLTKKGLGSRVILRGEKYKSGNPPSMAELANNNDKTPNDETATVWAKSDDLVILRSSDKIIVIQKSKETGNVEMIGFEVPHNITDKDQVIDKFREKQAANDADFVSAPTSITPLI